MGLPPRGATVTPPPLTMEQHHIKISFALILIVGGLRQLTLGGFVLVETQDKPAYFKQSGIQQRDYFAPTGDYSAASLSAETLIEQETCEIQPHGARHNPCGFPFHGMCTISACSKFLGKQPQAEKCIKECEDTFNAWNVTSINLVREEIMA